MYRKTFGIDYMERELERLGEALDSDVTIYLIGGGSMLYRDAKAATKDVDMVVTDPSYLTSHIRRKVSRH